MTWNYGNSIYLSGRDQSKGPSQFDFDKSGKFQVGQVEGFWRIASANLVDGTDLMVLHDDMMAQYSHHLSVGQEVRTLIWSIGAKAPRTVQ